MAADVKGALQEVVAWPQEEEVSSLQEFITVSQSRGCLS